MFLGDNTILVIGAHPDDEVLGAGGTIARHAASGDEVHVLIVTEGATQQYDDDDLIEQKKQDARMCADRLGAAEVHFGDLPDMRLDDVPHVEVNAVIESVCDQINPDIVYTHSDREVNLDHVAVYRSTVVATRPFTGISHVFAYETPSSTNWTTGGDQTFSPDTFVDISDHLDTKIDAFEAYRSEVREFPHPRSAEGLRAHARTRGSASGMPAAEAFQSLRSYH